MPRLFIALDMPEAARHALTALHDDTLDVRWAPLEQYHLTLRFLGETEAATAETVAEALADVRVRPFRLHLSGLGVFPSLRRPRVLVARAEAEPVLEALHRRVEAALGQLGFEPESRAFRPHVTLARFPRGRRPSSSLCAHLHAYLDRHAAFHALSDVRQFILYESVLRPEGALHRPLATFQL